MAAKIIGGDIFPKEIIMEPIGDKVLCEVKGPNYLVLAVGPDVQGVAVGDLVVFGTQAILHTRTPNKGPKVFVREGDILAKVPK